MLKKAPFLFVLLVICNINAQTPCSGGMAGSYPCNGITLQSYISASAMGAGEAQDSWGWTDSFDGKEYAVVALDNGTAFVDITNPTSPTYLGRLNSHTSTSLWRDVKIYNNHAYIVSDSNGNHGMQIFDLTRLRSVGSPPVSFTEDGWETWGTTSSNRGRAHNIIINEDTGYAYVVGVNPYISGGIVIFDLNTDPENPSIVATYSAGGYCHDAQVVIYDGPDPDYQGRELLIGGFSGSDFLRVLDVTNKSSITQISTIDYSNKYYTHQGWFTEDKRFFIVGDEVDEENIGFNTRTLVFDLQDLDNPVLHYTHYGSTPAIDHNGYVRGNRFYLANYAAGMRIFKIDGLYDASPSMTEINYFDTYPASNSASFNATWNVYPYFESGNLIATGFGNESISGDGGLFVLKDPNYDNVDPTVVCQNITATLDASTGTVSIDALDVDNGSTDNMGIVSRTLSGTTTYTCADVGSVFNVTLTVKDDYGNTSSCVASVTVAAAPTTYSGGSWSDGTPNIGSNAIIDSNYDTSSNTSIDACTCQVNNGSTLTINADNYLKTEGNITVAGSLIVEHQGSVVQTDPNATVDKVGAGTINVNLTTPDLGSRDFMVLGSPMTTETRNGVWDNAFLVLHHNTLNFVPNPDVAAAFPGAENFADDNYDNWTPYTGTITPGEGYIVRPQAGYGEPGGIFYYTYQQGTLNNGDITFNVLYNTPGPTASDNKNASPNVLANPYPSAIWANDLINANAMIDEVYFWEHNTPPSPSIPGAGAMNFSMEDISMYNLVGGTAAASGGSAPNGYIATGQGFGIKANAAGTATFTNTMRRTDNNNTLRESETLERIWIAVSNAQYEMQSSTLIAFSENATEGLDPGYDSKRLATVVSLYSHLEDGSQQLGIQSREPFESGVKVPLGFSTLITEGIDYTISISDVEGANLSHATVYLMDNLLNTVTILNDAPYTFRSDEGTFHNRFTLMFERNIAVLGPEDTALSAVTVFPNPVKNRLSIFSPYSNLTSIDVYDLLGKRLSENIREQRKGYSMDFSTLETGVYFVQITTEKGSVTKKVIKK